MVNAHIEMDLNNHVSVISSKIIQLIKAGEEMVIETLMKQFLKKHENYTPDQFMEGILFLFSLGCLTINEYKVILKNV